MELHEIRYFLALSKTLNFTKAAEACHVSQPALTRAIQKMEDELGGLLFSRERSNTHLTQLGRLIEPHLAAVAAQAFEVKRTAVRFLKLEKASLAIGVMCKRRGERTLCGAPVA
jgi:DNA-binding transcriptional LysR family regulator